MGETVDLVYPKVGDFVELIKQKGRGCLLYKKDLNRAFCQIQICPGDINLVSFVWKRHIFAILFFLWAVVQQHIVFSV